MAAKTAKKKTAKKTAPERAFRRQKLAGCIPRPDRLRKDLAAAKARAVQLEKLLALSEEMEAAETEALEEVLGEGA